MNYCGDCESRPCACPSDNGAPAFGAPGYWINGRGVPVAIRGMDEAYLINTFCFVARHVSRALLDEDFDDGPSVAHFVLRCMRSRRAVLEKLMELATELRARTINAPAFLSRPLARLLETTA